MVRGGGVGTGLGVGAGFWDWEIPHPFTRLLVKPRSFLKVFTACVGRNRQTENGILSDNFYNEVQLENQYFFSIYLSIHLSEKFIG